jgi:acetyl esterase/lipase
MQLMSCFLGTYRAWGKIVAARGVVVIMVDFRNTLKPSSVPEIAPFPAGLNDCISGLKWVYANAAYLNIDPMRILISGESSGGNLVIASAMKLKRDGDLHMISGIYAFCPYLAGEWSDSQDNSNWLYVANNRGAMSYGIDAFKERNPLAWPGFATENDVAGFPPVMISVNECDPLREDGISFYRLLLRSGVKARCIQVMGTCHAAELCAVLLPEMTASAALSLSEFAKRPC